MLGFLQKSWQENATTALAGMMFEVKKPMLCTCNCEMTCFVSLSLRFCLFLSLELCNDEVCHPRHEAIVMRRYECEMGTDIGLVHTLVWPASRPKYQNLETCWNQIWLFGKAAPESWPALRGFAFYQFDTFAWDHLRKGRILRGWSSRKRQDWLFHVRIFMCPEKNEGCSETLGISYSHSKDNIQKNTTACYKGSYFNSIFYFFMAWIQVVNTIIPSARKTWEARNKWGKGIHGGDGQVIWLFHHLLGWSKNLRLQGFIHRKMFWQNENFHFSQDETLHIFPSHGFPLEWA